MNVYFIKSCDDSQLVKIGKSLDANKRIQELQTGSPYELKLLGIIECKSDKEAFELEQNIHKQFHNLRVRGEWFRYSQNLRNFIKASLAKDLSLAKRAMEKNKQQDNKQHFHKAQTRIGDFYLREWEILSLVAQLLREDPAAGHKKLSKLAKESYGLTGDNRENLLTAAALALHNNFRPLVRHSV